MTWTTILGFALAGLLALGDGAGAAGTKHPPERNNSVTLTVWLMPNGPGDNWQSFLELIKPFTDANPRIKIEGGVVPWGEALSRIEAAVAGRIPAPDLSQLGTTWVAAIGATGKLLDLAGKYDEKLFPPAVLATTEVADEPKLAGKRFALPWLVDTRALYYNKNYCRQAGVDPAKDFATWESFRQSLRRIGRLSHHGKPVVPLGVTLENWNIIHNLSWWIWGAGGDFVGDDGDSGIASPATQAGLEFYIGLSREGLLSREAERQDQIHVSQMLRDGTIAMTISYAIGPLLEDEFGISPMPAGPKGRFTFLGGSALAVFNTSKHPAEALALLRFLSTEAAQVRYSMITGGLPAAAAQYDELLLQLDPIRGALVEQMKYGRAYRSIAPWGRIEVLLKEELNTLWTKATGPGPYDPADTKHQLEQLQKKIDEIIGRR